MTASVKTEWAWRARQFHAGFLRSSIAFAIVTGMAAGDQIFPGSFAGAGAGNDVIERHLARGQCSVAILAGVPVAHQDVLAR